MKRFAIVAIAGLALAGCETSGPSAPSGGAPSPDVSDLVGARGSSGESQLYARGYSPARTQGLTAYWWNGAARSCVEVVTGDGRYQSVTSVAPSQCGY